MTDPVELFLARAKAVRLDPQEKQSLYSLVIDRCPDRHTSRMTESPDEFVATARDISLSEAEHRTVFEGIRSYMDARPMRTRSWSAFPFVSLRFSTGVFAALLFVSASGVSAYAAEYALPGDSLYSLKVDIVEPLVDIVAFTPEAKTRWAARRVERRLQEAQSLIEDSALSTGQQVLLEQRLETQAFVLEQRLKVLQETSEGDAAAEEIAGQIEVVLEAHQELFAELNADMNQSKETTSLMDQIEEVRVMAGVERARLNVALQDATETEMSMFAEERIDAASDALRKAQLMVLNISDEQKTRGENRLAEASEYMTDARELLADGDERAAFAAATEAGHIARKLVILFEASVHADSQDAEDTNDSQESVLEQDDMSVVLTESASIAPTESSSTVRVLQSSSASSADPDEQEAVRTRTKVRDQIQRVRKRLQEKPDAVVEHLLKKGEEVQQEGDRAFERGDFVPAQERFREAWRATRDAEDVLDITPVREEATASGEVIGN